jgi:hypothetical protein
MEVGESFIKTIKAIEKWNDTENILVAGEKYHLTATGQWTDWFILCDACGYERAYLKPSEWLRRFPEANWFALIGSIEKDKQTFFYIGKERAFSPSQTGRLYCFANDVPFAYWNNKGSIQVCVTRLS